MIWAICDDCSTVNGLYEHDGAHRVICLDCIVALVDEATREIGSAGPLFTNAPTVCIHGTPIDAPFCLQCRLMQVGA